MECEHRKAAAEQTGFQGVYALENVCCVGRLIANTPQLARRRTMLDWYEKTKGKTFTEEVKQVILDRFKTERKV